MSAMAGAEPFNPRHRIVAQRTKLAVVHRQSCSGVAPPLLMRSGTGPGALVRGAGGAVVADRPGRENL